MSLRIQWGMVGQNTDAPTFTSDGVIALAADWVEQYAVDAGAYPSVRSCRYALIALCAERALEYRNTRDAYLTLSRWTAQLRRVGLFPNFEDPTRRIERPAGFEDADDILQAALARVIATDRGIVGTPRGLG